MTDDRRHERFRRFNEQGGKFRLAVVNGCNLRCFFCHNEGMAAGAPAVLALEDLAALASAWAGLGGRQINLTGGEPLALPGLERLLGSIEKGAARVVLNTNALLAERLTSQPRLAAVDGLLVSLHTTDPLVFARDLGGPDVRLLTGAILALRDHGYPITLNLSLGPYNLGAVPAVVRFASQSGLDLKIIALVRPVETEGFYGGDWVDPAALDAGLLEQGGVRGPTRSQLGGSITPWSLPRIRVEVKNVAQGRLRTELCEGCPHLPRCGEGVYGLRVGVDGVARPCLLRRDRFRTLRRDLPWREQLLEAVDAMIGDWTKARFETGAPG